MWNNLQGCRKHIALRGLQVQLSLKLIRNIMFYMIVFCFFLPPTHLLEGFC